MKRFLPLLLALCLFTVPAFAEEAAPIVGAKVVASSEYAVAAPVSGTLEPFTLRAGDQLSAVDTLFTIRPRSVYADVEGTIAAVYAGSKQSADAAVSRYGSVLAIERADRYELTANLRTGHNSEENRNPYLGTQVWLRSSNKKHFADGSITAVNGQMVTVQVRGGDLVFSETAYVYLSPEYTDKSLLMKGDLSVVAPATVSASGTVLSMKVKPGDAVKPGDLLFTYVPDALAADLLSPENPCAVQAGAPVIVASVQVTQGATVQKDQALCTVYPYGQYQLETEIDENDLAFVAVGSPAKVTFDELSIGEIEATVHSISSIGSDADTSRYTVRLSFDAPDTVRIGMHATISF